MTRSTLSFLTLIIVALTIGWVVGPAMSATRSAVEPPPILLGTPIPTVALLSMNGDAVELEAVRAGTATLFLVVDREDCLGCGNYPLEMRVLGSALPHLNTVLVLVGPDTAYFSDYAVRNRIAARTLLDPERKLLRALRLNTTPALILTDASGRILLTDHRDGPTASAFPISRLLPALAQTVTASDL